MKLRELWELLFPRSRQNDEDDDVRSRIETAMRQSEGSTQAMRQDGERLGLLVQRIRRTRERGERDLRGSG